jgi:hypothetical protein
MFNYVEPDAEMPPQAYSDIAPSSDAEAEEPTDFDEVDLTPL